MIHTKYYAKLADALLASEAHKATKYLSDKHVINATRILYAGKILPDRCRINILFTDGRPNYTERQFIKLCKKAGEPFPIRNIQLKFPPKKRK
jgi:hypothetical protein